MVEQPGIEPGAYRWQPYILQRRMHSVPERVCRVFFQATAVALGSPKSFLHAQFVAAVAITAKDWRLAQAVNATDPFDLTLECTMLLQLSCNSKAITTERVTLIAYNKAMVGV